VITHETPTGARWERLLSARDAQLIDAGAAGERTVAWSRLVITLILAIIPIQAVAAQPERAENWVGLAGTAVGLAVAVAVVMLLRRGYYRPWLGIASSVYDVSSVSAILVTFILIGAPQIAVNSRIVFEIYLLALSATCLRYDARTPLAAGAVAIVEYALIIAVVRAHWDLSAPAYAGYGDFNWGDQIGRVIVLGTATILSWTVLHRAERLRQLSMHDPLTGLLNRNVLEERVREEVMRARRYHRPLAVAMIDLDLFKRFNDAFGHAAGDVALRAFSRTLREAVRRTDIVARFGGEEFVVVLPETPGPDAAVKIEQIRADLEAMELQVPGSADGRMTLSAGVATLDPEQDGGLEILQRADDLLLAAKRAGRNCVMSDAGRATRASVARVDGGRGVS
jgi:diguanylate cyclase (GGDEF)-like protein